MRQYLLGLPVLAGLLFMGCGDDTGATGGGTSSSSSSVASSTASQTATSSSTATSSTTASSTSSGMAVCPPDGGDDVCTACAKDTCCNEYDACAGDAECTQCLACITGGVTAPADCVTNGECDLADPEVAATYNCTVQTCSNECYDGGFMCTPPDPKGDPCLECVKAECCTAGEECFESAQCALCISCAQQAANPMECLQTGACDLADAATASIFMCVNDSCGICLQ